ncbi:MAG: GNAT family N-acetyltransferase [Clostridia bacterium]|nr:GNAT family N-acetyltransferase [Clostridia bacterium]
MIPSFLLYRAALSGIYGQCHTFTGNTITDALFSYLDGTPSAESIEAVDRDYRHRPVVCLTPEWEAHIQKCYPDARVYTRTAMVPANHFVIPEVLPPEGYTVMPFDANAFDRHPFGHGENYADFADFEANGVGAVVWHDGEIVAAASSFLTLDKEIELDVSTLEAHRGKGLASACIALMLQNCAQRGITVHWDAQNDTSRHLAEKFGFHAESNYSVYWLPEKSN